MINNNDSIILVSKDALGKFYLPIYGNQYWKGQTPNLDELCEKGTVFNRHYTAAPSSAMSYSSMWTGVYAHETNRKDYLPIKNGESHKSLFDQIYELGFDCHIIWDDKWMTTAKLYSECYGEHVIYNSLKGIRQPVGAHQLHKNAIECDEILVNETVNRIESEITDICSHKKKVFIWMHLPHVIHGRNTYGSDIDVFDRIIGIIRKYFRDENIFISSDHGNMNGAHGKIGYGFDVYEEAICIPFITPRIDNKRSIDYPTTTCDLFDIIFNRRIPKRDVVYSDSAYYCQLNRKIAIIRGAYKYILNRNNHKEELYDIVYDPKENVNLIEDKFYDPDRHIKSPLWELYFYPHWKKLPEVREQMRKYKNEIWREGDLGDKIHAYYLHIGKSIWRVLNAYLHKYSINITIHSKNKK